MKKFMALILLAALIIIIDSKYIEPYVRLSFHPMFKNEGLDVWNDFRRGKYGSELYYLTSSSGGSSDGSIAIFKDNKGVQIISYQPGGRYQTRCLTNDEVKAFDSFIMEKGIDSLKDLNSPVLGGTEYLYMHFTWDKQATFYINNPDKAEGGDIYAGLVNRFFNLTKTEDIKTYYDTKDAARDVKVLIKKEDYSVQSVWKSGDDFRVLIKDVKNSRYSHQKLDWYKFKNGVVGEMTSEPEGLHMQALWADIPELELVDGHIAGSKTLGGFSFEEYQNTCPWQCAWKSYFVRSLHKYESDTYGLWLTKQGEEPKLISEGEYSIPIVIPGTDWVVCTKVEKGQARDCTIVKIDLNTFKETVIDLPPADSMFPVVRINDRLLIERREDKSGEFERYLYDAFTDTVTKVTGEFTPLYSIRGRFMQMSSTADKYFSADGQSVIGLFDTKAFTFTRLAEYPDFTFDDDHMWVDEDKSVVYLVIDGDLLELPIKLPK